MYPTELTTHRYCGREFTAEELEAIRGLIASDALNRAELSRRVCDLLGWRKPDGLRKDMSCRVALLRMHRDGLIALPPPTRVHDNRARRPRITPASDPCPPLDIPAHSLVSLEFIQIRTRKDSVLWNELIERYHYLGYQPLSGAQIRYFVFAQSNLLAALGFGSSAWKIKPRDEFIGWTPEQRKCNLHLVINNARYLILPWVRSPNLASRILSLATTRLPQDWEERYGYRPVLLETFVEERFQGICYRAANWIDVGQTQGRGKLDYYNKCALPVKRIFLFPLSKDFRQKISRH